MTAHPRTSGGTHCRAVPTVGLGIAILDITITVKAKRKKSLFNFPKDEERYVFSTVVIDQQSYMSL